MADYDFNLRFSATYDAGTDTYVINDVDRDTIGTLTDGDPDNQFTIDNNLSGGLENGLFGGIISLTSSGTGSEIADFVIVGTTGFDGGTVNIYSNVADPANFFAGSFVGSGIDDSAFTVCFAAGTLITTPKGETLVETLQIGDLVTTADGRDVPVKWIGRQTLHKLFTPAERFEPVRIKAGALGDGLPHADLVLTADHALILDGLAICAGALVNGTTITREPKAALPDRVTYYHIETEAHEVILANSAAAETYVDYVQRAAFDNHAEYSALYGVERTISEMSLPRISSARLIPLALRARLGVSAAVSPMTVQS